MAHHSVSITIKTGTEIEAIVISGEGREALMPGLTDMQVVEAFKMFLHDRLYSEASKIVAKQAVDDFIAANVSEAN